MGRGRRGDGRRRRLGGAAAQGQQGQQQGKEPEGHGITAFTWNGLVWGIWEEWQAEGAGDRNKDGHLRGESVPLGRRQAPAAPNHGALILRFYIDDAVVGQQLLPVSEIA